MPESDTDESPRCECCGVVHDTLVKSLPDRPMRVREVSTLKTSDEIVFSKTPMQVEPDHLDIEDDEPYTTLFVIGLEAEAKTVSYHVGVGWVLEANERVPEDWDPRSVAMDLFTATAERLDTASAEAQPDAK